MRRAMASVKVGVLLMTAVACGSTTTPPPASPESQASTPLATEHAGHAHESGHAAPAAPDTPAPAAGAHAGHRHEPTDPYFCSMHPEETALDSSARCPICGTKLDRREAAATPPAEQHAEHHHDAHGEPPAAGPAPAPPPEGAPRFADVEPFFRKHCARCHGPNPDDEKTGAKAREHLDIATYPFGGHHGHEALAAIGKVLARGKDGRTKMPADDRRGLKDDEIALVKRWIAAGGPK
ncbi:MAG: c-type cytochrome [Myxococcota bacterium]